MSTKEMTDREKQEFAKLFGAATADSKTGGDKVARVLAVKNCKHCLYCSAHPGPIHTEYLCNAIRNTIVVTESVQTELVSPLCPIRRIVRTMKQASPTQLDNLLTELGE